MSQRGSGRWVRGNCSFHLERDLGAWSVTWTRVEQLIVHYYTGVQLRDAAAGNTLLLPAARWNPLQIDWGTSDQRPPSLMARPTLPDQRRSAKYRFGAADMQYPKRQLYPSLSLAETRLQPAYR